MKSLVSPSHSMWKANVLVFGFLILVAQAHFYYQSRQVADAFGRNVREHAGLLSEVVRLNVEGAVFSEQVVRDILQTFLLNVSYFIDYLDSIKALGPEELAALSKELGLAGIRISTTDRILEGPDQLFAPIRDLDTIPANTAVARENRFYYRYPRFENGDILTSIKSDGFHALKEKMGLPELFKTVTGIAGIRYVRLAEKGDDSSTTAEPGRVRLLSTPSGRVAETRLPLGNGTMVIGMGCELYDGWLAQNRRSQLIFSILILGAGAGCSLLLYLFQRAHLARVREFDQALARGAEDAALGRATAAITHEIRNPLNAISMGLQRFSLEVADLDRDHQTLVADLLGSVKRIDHIIADLKRFVGPMEIRSEPVCLDTLLDSCLNLYESRIQDQGIDVCRGAGSRGETKALPRIMADPDLCGMVVENLIKNAVEAQPHGGFMEFNLSLKSVRGRSLVCLSLTNGGFGGDPERPEHLLESYVTTKTRGSGLGLAIVQRIVGAHDGLLDIQCPTPRSLEVRVGFPRFQESKDIKDVKKDL